MRKSILIFACMLVFMGCSENPGPAACGVENPIENLPWLKNAVQEAQSWGFSEYSYLIQASYQGNTVFYFGSCCPFCNWAIIIRDCQGNQIENVDLGQLKDQQTIWKPKNSVCENI